VKIYWTKKSIPELRDLPKPIRDRNYKEARSKASAHYEHWLGALLFFALILSFFPFLIHYFQAKTHYGETSHSVCFVFLQQSWPGTSVLFMSCGSITGIF